MAAAVAVRDGAPGGWSHTDLMAWCELSRELGPHMAGLRVSLHTARLDGPRMLCLRTPEDVGRLLGPLSSPVAHRALLAAADTLRVQEERANELACLHLLHSDSAHLCLQELSPDQRVAARMQAEVAAHAKSCLKDQAIAATLSGDMTTASAIARAYEAARRQEVEDAAVAARLARAEGAHVPVAAVAAGGVAHALYQAQVAVASAPHVDIAPVQRVPVAPVAAAGRQQTTSSTRVVNEGAGTSNSGRAGVPDSGASSSSTVVSHGPSRSSSTLIGSALGAVPSALPRSTLFTDSLKSRLFGRKPAVPSTAAGMAAAVRGQQARAQAPAGPMPEGLTAWTAASLPRDGALRVVTVGRASRPGTSHITRTLRGGVAARKDALRHDCCSVCHTNMNTSGNVWATFHMPCADGHVYCSDCMTSSLEHAARDPSLLPLKCCGTELDDTFAQALLDCSTLGQYRLRKEERTAVQKMYCPNPSCSKFINVDTLRAHGHTQNEYTCACGKQLCLACLSAAHPRMTCAQYRALPDAARKSSDDVAVEALARGHGWQQCPKCSFWVSLDHGCYHMTCRCGHQFCYLCAAAWKKCGCAHWDEANLLRVAEERVAVRHAAAGPSRPVAPQVARRDVAAAVERLRMEHDTCVHVWVRHDPSVARNCGNCGFRTYCYNYRCTSCDMAVCQVCRFHRRLGLNPIPTMWSTGGYDDGSDERDESEDDPWGY